MKTSSLRSFATSAALRFKFFASASRAVGEASADRAGQPYRICNGGRDAHAPLCSAKQLRALRASAFRFIQHSKPNIQHSNPLRPFATFAALRFKFFASASRAAGAKWVGHGGPALPVLLLLALPAAASTTWTGPTWNVSTAIPDNDEVGITDTRSVSIPGITEIQSVTVNLNFTGGWNGDLYAYLVHADGFTVLLNRPGRSVASPDGSAASGMSITIADSAIMDIHTAIPMSGGSVSGTYQPDGRETDPYNTLNTDARTAMLADFTGLDPNGTWKLFVADQSAGETSSLQSWSLTITAVPEPGTCTLLGLSVGALLIRRRPKPEPEKI
jgi:subtilisin-like proprotein convertase family protein